jgi:2-methylcitrate dehydratase PrpD
MAAKMAGAGHAGYPRIMEEGVFPATLGDQTLLPIDQPFEKEYAFKGSYLKPYPGCRHVHPSIDALAEILKGRQVLSPQIEKIRVRTYRVAVETEIHEVKTRGDAYFNIPYALAARIILGRNDWDAFDEKHFKKEDLVQLMKKIEVTIDPEVESLYPQERGSRVEMELTGGKVLTGAVRHALGEPENPLPLSVTREKFHEAASDFLTKKTMDRVEAMLDVSGPIEPPKTLFDALSGG